MMMMMMMMMMMIKNYFNLDASICVLKIDYLTTLIFYDLEFYPCVQ